jgi:branched-chain amino acid transport system ATP-binding protein
MLEVSGVRSGYGAINVLWGVSMHVAKGQVLTIVGPNGAGKTTLLRAIMGLIPLSGGEVRFDGKSLSGVASWDMPGAGLVMVPEGRMVFRDMTVEDNLIVGAFPKARRGRVAVNLARVFEMFPRLRERRGQLAGSLSGGEAQMLAIGRGLMAEPRLMLIDEPSLGLAPVLVDELFVILRRLREEGTTIVLVEQNTSMAVALADRVCLMQAGHMVLSEDAAAVNLDQLHQLYFGGAHAAGAAAPGQPVRS